MPAALACLVLGGCGGQESPKPAATNTVNTDNPLQAPAAYLATLDRANQRAIKTVDLTSLNKAIQAFEAEEGRRPKDLNELVSMKYLSKLPAPPRGMKFVYDANTGTVKVEAQ